MRKLSFYIILLLASAGLYAQSPHGNSIGKRDCISCHVPSTWKIGNEKMQFSHDETDFKLTGQHTTVSCASCHKSLVFSEMQTDCFSCHKDVHQNTVGADCARCHSTSTWIVKNIKEVHQLGRFPLVGVHQSVECQRCHQSYNNLNFQPINSTCYSCHSANYYNTKSPNHLAAGYSTDCSSCHSVSGVAWAAQNIQHDFFPLKGGHKIDNCFACHKQNTFAGLSQDCVSCHLSNYNNTTNPNHAAVKMSTDCKSCHTINSFLQATFNHTTTGFALTGKHNTISCNDCHKGTAVVTTTCVSCHQANFNSAPNHVAQSYPTDCTMCHSTTNWVQSTFNHAATAFPLTGAHSAVACNSCHTNGFGAIPITCVSCHQANFNSAPNHVAQSYPTDCTMCHSTTNWTQSTFNHATTAFPLTGAHTTVTCNNCHTNGFGAIPTTCVSCHLANYNATTNPNHVAQSYPTDCTMCHSTTNWLQSTFNHATTAFPLTGAHTTVTCNSCHTNGFGPIPTTCVSCHQANYNATTNPNHVTLALPTDCSTCHTTTAGWKPATFNIHNNYFVLAGVHTTLTCANCHNGNYSTKAPNTCYGCHKTNYDNTTNPSHVATGFGTDCQTCHSQTAWQPATFNHDQQFFPIYSGSHNGRWTTCADCHTVPTNYVVFSCMTGACHPQASTNNQHSGVQGYSYVASQCLACHPKGSGGGFNHSTSIFPLTGAHAAVSCIQCHQNGYPNTPIACVSCHQTDFNNTNNPNHKTLSISTDCQTCHSTTAGWVNALFPNHGTYFALTGAHVTTATCESCHKGNYTNATPALCVGCHQTSFNNAANPNHTAAGISTACETCHNSTAWSPSTFVHANTGFALTGKHSTVQCSSCHVGKVTGSSALCASCHQAVYNTALNHISQSYPTTCELCHNTTDFKQATFNHSNTAFPLTGAHTTVTCTNCHTNGFGTIPVTCVSCHQTKYNNTTNPSHTALKLATTCETCHTTTAGWINASFPNHSTYFALTGAHATTATCASCHNGNYTNTTPTSCNGCHQSSFTSAANPNHTAAGIPTACETCHNSTAWIPSTFVHTNTGFALTGKHTTIQCSSCHVGKVTGSSALCASCHQTVYNTALNHVSQSYPTTCELCHNTTDFKQATFNHQTTTFPLTGAHTTVTCTNCHTNGFGTIPITCVSCHQADYNSAANPSHTALSLATTCQTCHTTNTGWTPATFSTHSNYYVLAGAHTSLACSACHTNNTYNGTTPKTCIGCHQTDYKATTNPNHTASQFSTDCASCHTQTVWTGATFNHDALYFPIYSGRHNGRWTLCTQCHQDPANYVTFTCMSSGCHAKASIDSHHSGVKNYVYTAAACYSCHPKGNAGKIMMPNKKILD